MIELNRSTGRVLRYGITAGITVLTVGLIALIFSADFAEKILWVGVGIVIFVPFISVIVSAVALYVEKDFYWLRYVLMVIAISVVGMIVSYAF